MIGVDDASKVTAAGAGINQLRNPWLLNKIPTRIAPVDMMMVLCGSLSRGTMLSTESCSY